MCERAQERIKTSWRSRITGNAIKAAAAAAARIHSIQLGLISERRVCTLRGLARCFTFSCWRGNDPSAIRSRAGERGSITDRHRN